MLDPLATTAAGAVLRAISGPMLSAIGKRTKSSVDKLRASFASTFQKHLEITYGRCANVRTIFSNDRYIPLSSIYVNLTLTHGTKVCRDEDIILNSTKLGNIVVVGTGGAGKTMLMRHLALMMYQKPLGKIPLFIELRQLPRHDPKEFYQTIYEMITPERDQKNYSLFLEGMRAGVFVLQLDGLDEVAPSQREQVFHSIQRIPLDFPELQVIASTRPEIDTRPWDHFSAYKVNGINLDQARLLISKIEYPENLKSKFIALLDDSFYNKHVTFLSVPLLCTLMLITFNEFHEIPSRVTVFYEQAFETLYRRHDTSKEGFFKRVFSTNLSSDRFRTLFSAFCYRTLAFNEVSFSDERLRLHIRKACEATEIEVNADDFASDLVSAVCMIMRDGLKLHFIHRSFQDYFAAIYILRHRGPDTFEVYDRVITDLFISNIVEMAADIDLQTFEREWALPAVAKIDGHLKRTRKSLRVDTLIRKVFATLRIDGIPPTSIRGWAWTADCHFMRPLQAFAKIAPSYFKILHPHTFGGDLSEDSSAICDLPPRGIVLPRAVEYLCNNGKHMSGDGYTEALISEVPMEWLKDTTFYRDASGCVIGMSDFHRYLRSRISTRDKIDILE